MSQRGVYIYIYTHTHIYIWFTLTRTLCAGLLAPLEWLYQWTTLGLLLTIVLVGPLEWLLGCLSAGIYRLTLNSTEVCRQPKRLLCIGTQSRAQVQI